MESANNETASGDRSYLSPLIRVLWGDRTPIHKVKASRIFTPLAQFGT
ncbi:hypothetical protein NC997_25415 [Trichocoleus sp. DQ-A2]